jgi:hypothetical protein
MDMPVVERRRHPRTPLQIPVGVEAHAGDGTPWHQWALTQDVSAGGVRLELGPGVAPGQVLFLELPLPSGLRQFDADAPIYGVYGVVRCVVETDELPHVGVQFLGRKPPDGYERHPGALFLLSDDAPAPVQSHLSRGDPWERRHSTRFPVLVNLVLQKADTTGRVEREELTVSDDISKEGLRVKTTFEAQPGDVLIVKHTETGFESRVGVCDSWVAADGVRRLNLRFLDGRTGEPFIGK